MFPRENNPNWPLCQDYYELSADGQRQARIHVLRDCTSPQAYVTGHLFFRNYYLRPEGPKFYGEGGLLPAAPGHIDMLYDFCLYPMSVEAYTRGGGKTTIFARELPLREIVCFPHREVVVCSATEKLIKRKSESVRLQLSENALIFNDFGRLTPKRSEGRTFNDSYMKLMNGAVLEQLTVGSRQRGTRTTRYILDDPEYDPDSTNQERYTEMAAKLERHILKIVLPMLKPGRIKFFWIGTMIGSRSYLYHVCYSRNAKFKSWNRRIQSGAILDPETGRVISSTWKQMFTPKHLQFLKDTMGDQFNAEFMNQPVKESERLLKVEPVRNFYYVDKLPENLDVRIEAHLPHPEAVMTYHYFTGYNPVDKRMMWQKDQVNQAAHFDAMKRIATIDYAKNRTSTSDMKAIAITGFDARNTEWVLDLWAGRMPNKEFLDHILRFCGAWRVHIIAPEAVALQEFLVDAITRRLWEGESEGIVPIDWRPTIVPITYPKGAAELSKGKRIRMALEYPLTRGAVKLPGDYKHKWPFNESLKQIAYFTEDLQQLRYDDLIDVIAMPKYVPHGRGEAAPTKGINPVADVMAKLSRGEGVLEGQEGMVGMPVSQIREEYLAMAIQHAHTATDEDGAHDNVWNKAQAVG